MDNFANGILLDLNVILSHHCIATKLFRMTKRVTSEKKDVAYISTESQN